MHSAYLLRPLPPLLALATVSALLLGCSATGDPRTETRSYTVSEEVRNLTVHNGGGDIEVAAGSGTAVRVTEILDYTAHKPTTGHDVASGELRITSSGCEDTGVRTCGVRFRIEVPGGIPVKLDTDGGDIVVRKLSAATVATTDGGSVRIEDSAARSLVAHTAGGDIEARMTAAPDRLSATTDGGDVSVRLPGGPYALDVATEAGSRKVGVAHEADAPRKVKVYSKGGDVQVVATG
ncbi:DUF4097 family beta strand repeat-containing protein [Streptomyces globisporus]|uniref:DUF4097 family beta strand repeat-containing protein n=1 Tax=Streptomyces globisporus TaxID=1908 RepID=UPI00068D7319|nr:DUF4097 family beta strand repeat-containing protein [Streptomyces globisporus]